MPYKYRLTINTNDNITYKLVDNKEELCKILDINMSTLGNIMAGRIKNKYNYITIEKIKIYDKNDNEEYKKMISREASRKYAIKQRLKKLEEKKKKEEEYKNKIVTNLENE